MKEVKFEEIWNNVIKPILGYKLSEEGNPYYLGEGPGNKSEMRHSMESWYNSSKDRIKAEFMRQSNKLVDRHKVCACIFKAIVEVKILKIKKGSLEKERLINTEIAFLVACVVLSSFMLHDAKKVASDLEDFLNHRKLPCFPEIKNNDSNDSYVVQTIKALCYDQKQGHLSILALANIFCLLEIHTKAFYSRDPAHIHQQVRKITARHQQILGSTPKSSSQTHP
jgi:hypothetical protein